MILPPIYLDHAATTPVRPEVRDAMLPYLDEERFGNPSSGHGFGRAARAGLEQARQDLADALGTRADRVVFTSGGTEADNLAVVGCCLAARRHGDAMLAAVGSTEHKAVLESAHMVQVLGGSERLLRVSGEGLLDLEDFDQALSERPAVVSVMWVNNETGVVQPIPDLARRCREAGVPFHTDMVQAFGKLPIHCEDQGIQLATVSAHKIGGPKGVGALVLSPEVRLEPLIRGGSQQRAVRPGTENIAGAVGLARAALLAVAEREREIQRLTVLRDRLVAALRARVADLQILGEMAPRTPHLLLVAAPDADSGALLMYLDQAGVAASSGSACTSGATEPSHVTRAMGIPRRLGAGVVRFSLGHDTTDASVDRAAVAFEHAVTRSRGVMESMDRG
jgi:cysteine desulfurase